MSDEPLGSLRAHRRAAALRTTLTQRSPGRPRRLHASWASVRCWRCRSRTSSAHSACSRWSRPDAARLHRPRRQGAPAARRAHGCGARRMPRRSRARQARLEERTQALQESEQRFKQLVDVAQEGIWVADDRGVITYVNQRMAELLGYQNGELLGRPVYDFIEAGSRAGAQRTLARPDVARDESHDLRFRRRDGSEVWGLVSASPIVGEDGGLVGHRRHGHRHHRAKADRGAAPPLGRAAGDAARHGPGDPRRAVARRRSAARRWAGSAGWSPASAARSCSSISSGARRS